MDTSGILPLLFSQYFDEKIITHVQLPKTTSGNDAHIISTKTQKYILRILARGTTNDITKEYELQARLQKSGIVTPFI